MTVFCVDFRTGRTDSVCLSSFLSDQKSRGCQTILVDPVMGDHGKPYRTITPKHCQKLRSLIPLADIITPNITEACLLTDTLWKDGFWNESELSELCQRLHKLNPSKIVITGLPCLIHGKEGFENYLSCREPFSQRACLTPSAGLSRHGTGDIFASILMADALNGVDFSVSVQKAADFISKCISASNALQIPEPDGVCFEKFPVRSGRSVNDAFSMKETKILHCPAQMRSCNAGSFLQSVISIRLYFTSTFSISAI